MNMHLDMQVPMQHGRTDGRTDVDGVQLGDETNLPNAHARTADGVVSLAEVIAVIESRPDGRRHEVTRTGEREPISTHVRSAIWFRDGGRCKLCFDTQAHYGETHLDHIKPWSAGGSDTTDNLRILCARHNVERSNFVDDAAPARPATWWCINCYSRDGYGWDYALGRVTCGIHGHGYGPNGGCRVINQYNRQLLETLDGKREALDNWHEREPMFAANATRLAYCAHCDAPGMTDRPL